ncbi:DUF3604 domain-containing protein [Luminiphilus sp.]|nr:DUF3604 domain-containing protein [Luminiphilus sp.]MDA9722007.1 DUF3604 domain-containing protein [Luminiphilus sp.]
MTGLLVWAELGIAEPSPGRGATRPAIERVFWGDLHLHSNLSPDAYIFENRMLGPPEAYQFAAGEGVLSSTGTLAKLDRPLDFLAVTDHAEYLGVFASVAPVASSSTPAKHIQQLVLISEVGSRWAKYMAADQFQKARDEFVANSSSDPAADAVLPDSAVLALWQASAKLADRYNKPGEFTTLIGYEWTSMIDGNNFHRVVLFGDDAKTAGSLAPFSAMDSRDVEDLWAFLSKYESTTGGRAMAIPHNSNLSNGRMFPALGSEKMSESYARQSARWEPLFEATQVKGDAETHPLLSPDDPFADFETWDAGNILATEEKTPDMLVTEYARSLLGVGIATHDSLGVNPYQFGLIGSTDSHTALSTADAGNYFGKFADSEPSVDRTSLMMAGRWSNAILSSSGYVAVWAEDNTREALFDALQRREVYASTGPRITLRLFAGWGFTGEELYDADFAAQGYRAGVPMGGQLTGSCEETGQVSILVKASRDPMGANLDRIQIVKGWMDQGEHRERVYDVALSDGRKVGEAGQVLEVGNTVDIQSAAYANTIGAAELGTVWTDWDFDPEQQAFYYARVLEIPTPRWTTHDAAAFGIPPPDNVPGSVQQRVYSSPVWYEPPESGANSDCRG